MKEDLRPGRWFADGLGEGRRPYLKLAPVLLIGFLVGLFLVASAGQSRLEAANERVHNSQLRQQALSEYLALIATAETAERGYLLTGEGSYLQPYLDAVPRIGPALDRVHRSYDSAGAGTDQTDVLRILTGRKLAELADTLALYRARGAAQALDIVRTDLGRQTMDEISKVVAAMRLQETEELSTHLQAVSEQEKYALSRELHDELGGLLVAARMDLSWLQQRLPLSDPAVDQRFRRIHESLSAGVDLKRRVVEELRPTLLDNMGLYSALQWQFKETCRRSGLKCTENIPQTEHRFNPDSAIGIFRIAQETFTNILKHANAKAADLTIDVDDEEFMMRITDDGRGISGTRLRNTTSHGLVSMKHRVNALGGRLELRTPSGGGTVVTVRIPVSRILLPETA